MRRLAASATLALTASAGAATCEPLRSKIVGKTDVASTRWIKLQTIAYEDPTGRSRKWDMASRTTKRHDAPADAVAILALLRRQEKPDDVEMLLVQQFRPPVDAITVELPAGLIDPGETAERAAVREVRGCYSYACCYTIISVGGR